MSVRTALLLGATGLVGRHVLDFLLEERTYAAVVTLGRRPLGRTHRRLTHHVVDFERLYEHDALFSVHDVYCCLGTTMRQAGSREAFRRVDFDYAFEAARLTVAEGGKQFLLVSALGADRHSRFFYNRVKGEAEDAVRALPLEGVYIARPSLLTGNRTEARWGEQVGEAVLDTLSFALRGPLDKLRPIQARTVAAALVELALEEPGGVQVCEPACLRRMAARRPALPSGNKTRSSDLKGHG